MPPRQRPGRGRLGGQHCPRRGLVLASCGPIPWHARPPTARFRRWLGVLGPLCAPPPASPGGALRGAGLPLAASPNCAVAATPIWRHQRIVRVLHVVGAATAPAVAAAI